MNVEKLGYKHYYISDIIQGQYVKCIYFDYTKQQARKLFKQRYYK